MLSAISTALSIGGAVTSTSTSWLTILIGLIVMVMIWTYEEQIKDWIQGKIPDETAKRAVGSKPFRIIFQIAVGFILMWIVVIFSNISILRPNLFVGYTSQPPFKFGRYIASVGRAANPSGGYCPQAEITGDIVNTSDQELWVWFGGQPIRVWTLSPSVAFGGPSEVANIAFSGSHSSIMPGSGLQVTISAQMDPSLCTDYKENDLRNLRSGRINATTSIWVSNNKGQNVSLQAISFLGLPIALGD
jgi:hypothetical protein